MLCVNRGAMNKALVLFVFLGFFSSEMAFSMARIRRFREQSKVKVNTGITVGGIGFQGLVLQRSTATQ